MCGFVGFANLELSAEEQQEHLRSMIRGIAHRGLEEMGYYIDDFVGLGTVRLAIIDRPLGKQPMSTPDDRYWLGFNGELFNYLELRDELAALGVQFRTDSDTEVLLEALRHWGRDALHRLNGQYGFVFYDRLEKELMFVRDRLGERPAHYALVEGGIAFASEIKALFAFPAVARRLSPRGLRQACSLWTPVPGNTCFEGVVALPPGHFAVYRDGRIDVGQYYRLPYRPDKPLCDPGEAKEALRESMTRSVELRLRADFERGAFLSGGIDSSVVACLAQQQLPYRMKTFGLAVEDASFDESAYATRVADWLGTEHSTLTVSRAEIRELFPDVVRQAEAPLYRTAAVASRLLAYQVHNAGLRVALGGEGGDEVLLGYDLFKEAAFLERFDEFETDAQRRAWLAELFFDMLKTAPIETAAIVRFHRSLADDDVGVLGPHLRRFRAEPGAELFRAPGEPADDEAELLAWLRAADPAFDARTVVERAQVLDTTTILSGYGLSCQCDRVGAGAAVEARFPFLDPAVIETAYAMPEELKLREGRVEKHVLREAFAADLPDFVTNRPKQAMRAPGAECLLLRDEDDWVAALLSEDRLRRSAVVDPAKARDVIERAHATRDGRVPYPHSHAYLQLLSALILEEAYGDGFRVPDVDIERRLIRRVDGRALEPAAAAA
jgi:asparagine synthase (glutamine-hydrolysing)